MGWHPINVNLNKKGISKLLKKLEFLHDNLPEVDKLFVEKSLDYLEKRAKHHLSVSVNAGFSTGDLMTYFRKEYDLGRLINDCAYARFVEFGVGIIGANNAHPKLPEGWVYDVNDHGEAGWVYKNKDGEYRWTQGQEPHRFMYNAVNDYLLAYKKIYSDAFDKIMQKELRKQ